jgi:Big-like domain-containing protein
MTDRRQLERIERKIDRLIFLLIELIRFAELKLATSAICVITTKGEIDMGQALTVHVNDVPGVASIQEFTGAAGTGTLVPPIGPVVFASDNPSVATVDPASGQLAYLTAGTANISATDQGNGLTDSCALTVVTALATSLVETLTPGTPLPVQAARGKVVAKK